MGNETPGGRWAGGGVLVSALLIAFGCGSSTTSGTTPDAAGPPPEGAAADNSLVPDGRTAPADAGQDVVSLDAGEGSVTLEADSDAPAPCPDEGGPLFEADGAPIGLPACDPASEGRTCSFFESYATCVQGQWLLCDIGAPANLCLESTAPPEGSPCCPLNYQRPFGAALCCPGGRSVSCGPVMLIVGGIEHIAYGDLCADAAADAGEAGADAGDAGADAGEAGADAGDAGAD
jgi:hypothetical protein